MEDIGCGCFFVVGFFALLFGGLIMDEYGWTFAAIGAGVALVPWTILYIWIARQIEEVDAVRGRSGRG